MIYKTILNNIKDLYIYNKSLAIGMVICLIECLMYIISIEWNEWFPHANEWYNFVYNLGLAYICAYIFFILQIYIPEKTKNTNSLNIIRPSLHSICERMEYIIAFCDSFVDFSNNKIKVKDRDEEGIVYYKFIKQTNNGEDKGKDYKKVINYFSEYEGDLKKLVEEIKSKTVYKDCDRKLIELIAKLEYNAFPRILKSMERLIDESNIEFSGLKEIFVEFKSIKSGLEKFDTEKTKCQFEHLNKEEIKQYKAIIKMYS